MTDIIKNRQQAEVEIMMYINERLYRQGILPNNVYEQAKAKILSKYPVKE